MPKNQFNKLVLNIFFSQIIKIRRTISGVKYTASKINIKQKNQYLNLKISRHDQRSIFSLKRTGFKLILRQEKRVFTTLPKIQFYWFPSQLPCNQICSTWQKYLCIKYLGIWYIWCQRTFDIKGHFYWLEASLKSE